MLQDDELMHYGRKGMKWGISIFGKKKSSGVKKKKNGKQVVDSLTEKKTSKGSESTKSSSSSSIKKEAPKERTVKDMSDNELQEKINRIRLEQEYARLNPRKVSAGEAAVNKILNDVVIPSATNAARNALQEYAINKLKKSLGLNQPEDPIKVLQKQVNDMNLRKQKIELDEFFEKRRKNNSK